MSQAVTHGLVRLSQDVGHTCLCHTVTAQRGADTPGDVNVVEVSWLQDPSCPLVALDRLLASPTSSGPSSGSKKAAFFPFGSNILLEQHALGLLLPYQFLN